MMFIGTTKKNSMEHTMSNSKKHSLFSASRLLTYFITMALLASTPAQVLALEIDYGFFSDQDIMFYDPNACRIATGIGTGNEPTTGIIGADRKANIEAVLRFFTGKGLSLAAASGFVGNMTQESGVNPRAVQPGKIAQDDNYQPVNGTGFGLVQWTFTARQAPLVSLARSTNRNTTDMSLQLDYVWQELNAGYQQTLSKLNTPGITPEQATIIIHGNTAHTRSHPAFAIAPKLGYEASGDSPDTIFKRRVPPAVAAYNEYVGKIADGDSSKIQISDTQSSAETAGNPLGAGDCGDSVPPGTPFSVNGMTLPVVVTKQIIEGGSDGKPKNRDEWCWTKTTNCHHDYNAVDFMVPEGTKVVAVKSGTIVSVNNNARGPDRQARSQRATIGLRADDDQTLWWMTHGTPGSAVVAVGQKVASGAPLMTVGNRYAANNTPPHLHIDQLPSQFKERVTCAGAGCKSYPFVDIQPMMKQIYDQMIASPTGQSVGGPQKAV